MGLRLLFSTHIYHAQKTTLITKTNEEKDSSLIDIFKTTCIVYFQFFYILFQIGALVQLLSLCIRYEVLIKKTFMSLLI